MLTCAPDLAPDIDVSASVDPLAKNAPPLPCQTTSADLWFGERPAELEQAKALCQTCPARLACLAAAIDRREVWGVWGGEIFERGNIVAFKRGRGRPKKADAA